MTLGPQGAIFDCANFTGDVSQIWVAGTCTRSLIIKDEVFHLFPDRMIRTLKKDFILGTLKSVENISSIDFFYLHN